jgi:hypothetical protein
MSTSVVEPLLAENEKSKSSNDQQDHEYDAQKKEFICDDALVWLNNVEDNSLPGMIFTSLPGIYIYIYVGVYVCQYT